MDNAYNPKLEREYASLTTMKRADKRFVKEWLAEFLSSNTRKDSMILDAGCFDGNVMEFLKEKGFQNLYGIEINDKLRKKASSYGTIYGYDLEKKLPIKDKTFDVVLEIDIHEHLYNIENFISETARIMKDDGYLVIFTSNHQHISKRIMFLFGIIGYKAFGFGEHHVRFVSHDIFKKWLEPYFDIKHVPRQVPLNNVFKRHCWYVCRKKNNPGSTGA